MSRRPARTVAGPDSESAPVQHEVLIVGAGFGGIGVGIGLQKIGIHDFVILEQADGVGGTWRDNSYPGLEVDVPSFSYSYMFEPKADWSQLYAPGSEVQAYAEHCADKFGLRRHIRFGRQVIQARFDEANALWRVSLQTGEELTARYLVNACGYLSGPRLPEIDGIDAFAGKIMHTARWDHDYDLTGKRVAIIGTGATGIQVAPAIVDKVAHLDVYQRTAIWLAPKINPPISRRAQRVMRRAPVLQRAARAYIWFVSELFFRVAFQNHRRYHRVTEAVERFLIKSMRKKVDDPATQEKLIPNYSFFCKRPSFSNTFYPMFNRDNVDLVTDGITHVTERGLATVGGAEREADVLVCATGFHVFDRSSAPMFEIIGEGDTNLRDWWDENRYQAYLGTTVPQFPNLFLIFGPYAASGSSYFDILNNQVVHIGRVLRAAKKRASNYAVVRPEVHERDFAKVQRKAQKMVLYSGDCATSNTYYFDGKGDSPAAPRPSSMLGLWLTTRLFRLDNYRFELRTGRPVHTDHASQERTGAASAGTRSVVGSEAPILHTELS
ncbi:NAD(P)/FAD-dependent oxidoreductase [Sporichthya sp.]|uniref:flavin-containing monooxygenase n=1 Tax=Sporichthya sp. TaxID=65475 RepID=UPI00184BAE3E|nr:NAD(P)/FAD-dependent oxidoreductase [Sporichthya sp.]MBA3741476.1 NAD(P)/FAD-dependent oxidoreductase [Sporichthya sp.]